VCVCAAELYGACPSSGLLAASRHSFIARRDALFQPLGRVCFSWWLLHDNLPVFRKGLVVRRYVHEQGIQELEFPPRSPDLNPTENIFGAMRKAVDQHHATTVPALIAAWRTEWERLPHTLHSALVCSMRERCMAVKAAGGGATHY
jgi:DDE superfamily endonuclease